MKPLHSHVVVSCVVACMSMEYPLAADVYNIKRSFEALPPVTDTSASALEKDVATWSGVVRAGPTPPMVSTRLVEIEGLAVGYTTKTGAWAAAAGTTNVTDGVSADNAGWLGQTKQTEGAWSAFRFELKNEFTFRPADSLEYRSPGGGTSSIARVMVGSLGDWCLPRTGYADGGLPVVQHVGPNWKERATGHTQDVDCVFGHDLSTYYKLVPSLTIPINRGDGDGDGIPGYLDGFNADGVPGNADDRSAGDELLPWRVVIPEYIALTGFSVVVSYDESDPSYQGLFGSFRLWLANEQNERLRLVPPGRWEPVDLGLTDEDRTLRFLVEAVNPTPAQDVTIHLQGKPNSGMAEMVQSLGGGTYDRLTVASSSIAIVPDWNRDRVIDDSDRGIATAENPLRFWINRDDDVGDVASDIPMLGSDYPDYSENQPIPSTEPDHDNLSVDGSCDLLDFIPLWLDLGDALRLYPPGPKTEYRLKQKDHALRFVWTSLSRDQAGAYITTNLNVYGENLDQPAKDADSRWGSLAGLVLPDSFLRSVAADPSRGVVLVEGRYKSTQDLVLEVKQDGAVVMQARLPLSVDKIEKMYRWINLRHVTGGFESRGTDLSEPDNNPDSCCNDKHVIAVHGYNNDENAARAFGAEVFKRLRQSGSNAKFTVLTWEGDEHIAIQAAAAAYYHKDVINAFEVSPAVASAVNNLEGAKELIGHSLGNMVISSAIVDHGLQCDRYFMLDAAVSMESYNGAVAGMDLAMTPSNWAPYQERLQASEWHKLFAPGDGRRALTWRDRFGDIPQAVNFYSSGEEVLMNSSTSNWYVDPPGIPDTSGEKSWITQELVKGRWQTYWIPLVECHGGWGFNDEYDHLLKDPIPETANALTDDQVRTEPLFVPFLRDTLIRSRFDEMFGPEGSTHAADYNVRARLLAEAIPSKSWPAGSNRVAPRFSENIDMMTLKTGWPASRPVFVNEDGEEDGRWLHGDLKNVAYRYNHRLYERMVQLGALYEP